MKRPILPIAIALLLICGVGGFALRARSQQALAAAEAQKEKFTTVQRGDIVVSVIETGTIDASKVVEVKGRVTGRLARLLVDEGDLVRQGQLIAVIDPKETSLRVEQDAAQLRGAESSVARSSIEIAQRRITARAAYDQAKSRVAQLALELKAQPTVTRSTIEEAQTALDTALAERDRLQQSVHPNQRTAAQSAVDEAQANYDNAQRDYKRQSDLADKGYVAGRLVDNAKLSVDLAKVRLDSAKDNLSHLDSALRAEISKANEAIAQARAGLRRAQANNYLPETKRQDYLSAVAELEKARAALDDPAVLQKQREQSMATVSQLRSVLSDSQRQLSETEIRAPISGVVTKKSLQVGELATGLSSFSSGSTIVKIEDRTGMRVKLDINEIDMAKLRLGMDATIDVDAIPGKPYHGIVQKIAPASKESPTGASSSDAVVKYEVEIVLQDADAKLRSGMSAKCTVDVIRKNDVLTLPLEYIVREGRKAFVQIPPANPKAKGAKPEKRQVTLGAETGAKVEIVSGLKEGDKVVKPKFNGPERKGFMQAGPDE
jgi:HlyD family secretion protein